MKFYFKYIYLAFFFFFFFLIIIFSTANEKKSRNQSDNVTEIIIEVFDKISGDSISISKKYDINNIRLFVRKFIGHFCLFACLGIFASISFLSFILNKKKAILIIFLSGFLIALLSEIFQIFADGRVPSITDIGIDYLGYLLTSGICIAVYILLKKMEVSQKKKA